jgi:hypothetical protein
MAGIEDSDYLAYSIILLCSCRHGVLVVLLDIDSVDKHVYGSKHSFPCEQVSFGLHLSTDRQRLTQ